jgi:hypothetical protein
MFYKNFKESPVNPLDFAIFSKLAYFDFGVFLANKKFMRLSEIGKEKYLKLFLDRPSYNPQDKIFAESVSKNPRFKNVIVKNFVSSRDKKIEEQFSAVTFQINFKTLIIVFRGTDGTTIGRKEDFNMPLGATPGQLKAIEYVNKVAHFNFKKLYVCGHSKGGNLAYYGSLNCKPKYQKRLVKVLSFDGPGLEISKDFKINNPLLETKFIKYVPENSVFGLLFEKQKNLNIVEADGSFFYQHDLYNWKVSMLNISFIKGKKLSEKSLSLYTNIDKLLNFLNLDTYKFFVDTTFELMDMAKITYSHEIFDNKITTLKLMREQYKKLDSDKKNRYKNILKTIVPIARKAMK